MDREQFTPSPTDSASKLAAKPTLDPQTDQAARAFMRRLEGKYAVLEGIVYGSRARHTHTADSDADLAVVLEGKRGDRYAAAGEMARIAFDVMLETGIMVEALPLWAEELVEPQAFSNRALIDHIRRDGMRL